MFILREAFSAQLRRTYNRRRRHPPHCAADAGSDWHRNFASGRFRTVSSTRAFKRRPREGERSTPLPTERNFAGTCLLPATMVLTTSPAKSDSAPVNLHGDECLASSDGDLHFNTQRARPYSVRPRAGADLPHCESPRHTEGRPLRTVLRIYRSRCSCCPCAFSTIRSRLG